VCQGGGGKAKFSVNLAFSLLDTHHRRALVFNLSTTSWEKPVQAAFAKNSLKRKASAACEKKRISPQLSKAILTHADAALCAGVAGKQLVGFLAVAAQSCVMRTHAGMSGEVNSTRISFRHG
jgi:hypothetical protein